MLSASNTRRWWLLSPHENSPDYQNSVFGQEVAPALASMIMEGVSTVAPWLPVLGGIRTYKGSPVDVFKPFNPR